MPLMLDNGMSIDMEDDLFGDGVGLLPLRPLNKQIRQRIDEMRVRGCCQSIAWSRTGTIASIRPGGRDLELRHLRSRPSDGEWDLSEPTICELVQGTESNPLVHLEWAATNSPELAIFDSLGRLVVVSFSIALNHPFMLRNWAADPVDNLNSAAGCYWLPVPPPQPQKPYNILHGPANKANNGYHYTSTFVNLNSAGHPSPNKTALVSVTTGGMLKLFWPQNSNQFHETTRELESVHSSDDIITHAAITSDKSHLLVAIATSSKRLRLHRVDIQWNVSGMPKEKTPIPQPAVVNPTLSDRPLASTSWFQSGSASMAVDPSLTELSSLTVLPSLHDNSGASTVPPMVVCVKSSFPPIGGFGDGQSVIDRWEAVEQRQGLAPAFEQLGSRRNSNGSNELPNVTRLRKLESIVFNKLIIRVQTMHFGKTILLNFSDGSVEYRDRYTFEEIYTTQDLNQIMHLRQVGWAFPESDTVLEIAYSPTFCSMIQVDEHGKLKWSKMQYDGEVGDTMQDPAYSGCVAGLTVSAASAMWYSSNIDDLLAIVAPYTRKKRFNLDWVGELVRILKVQIDYTDDQPHDSLMRNAALQYCLSIMHSVGFRGRSKKLSFCSKMAMVNLNVRNVTLLITMAVISPPALREKINPLDEHEVVSVLTDSATWAFDMLAWLADSLFELMNDSHFMELLELQKGQDVVNYLVEKNNVSLHLILCSSSRSLLSALCRRMDNVEKLSQKAHEHYQQQRASGRTSGHQPQAAYEKMKTVTDAGLIKIKALETILNTFSADIRQAYGEFLPRVIKQQPNAPTGKDIDVRTRAMQSQCELAMFLCSAPAVSFLPILHKFLDKDIRTFRTQTDASKLYFHNYDLVEVRDSEKCLKVRADKDMHVDAFRRVDLGSTPREGQLWRRCTRCAAVMEDLFGSKPGLTFLLNQQRKCSCGGFWSLLPPGKLLI